MAPLTEEQLAQISAETKHAASKALSRYRKEARIGFAILLIGLGFSLHDQGVKSDEGRTAIVQSGRVVSVDGCNRDFNTIGILRSQIIKGKATIQQYVEDGTLTQRQADRQVEQTDDLLAKYQQPDCRRAEKILTDESGKVTPVPKPLYPKGKK